MTVLHSTQLISAKLLLPPGPPRTSSSSKTVSLDLDGIEQDVYLWHLKYFYSVGFQLVGEDVGTWKTRRESGGRRACFERVWVQKSS